MLKQTILFIFLLACLGCGLSCGKTPADSNAETKPLLLTSIAPYRFLTEQIAGPDFIVQTVVPPMTNPHSYEPTSNQVAAIATAQVWFRIGEPFEEKVVPILKGRNPHLSVLDLRSGISLIQEGSLSCSHCSMDHFDRHIWLSPNLAADQARAIAKLLGEKFPEKKALFEKNLATLTEALAQLDQEIHALLGPVKERVILVSHPAFGYFCRDYGFEQLSVEYEGKDPRPKHLEQILKKASLHQTELALALPQYNNKGAQLIAEKLQLPVHLIDPYSFDYFEMMRKLAHLIANSGAGKE